MWEKLAYNFRTSLESLAQNKLRAFLTSLGIICGVASVIAMMAIGEGAKESVLQQLADLGSHNIIVTAKAPDQVESEATAEGDASEEQPQRFTPGLTLKDAQSILTMVPGVKRVCPEVSREQNVLYQGRKGKVKVTGITNEFFNLSGFQLEAGNAFTHDQFAFSRPVCIIGDKLRNKLFGGQNPIGQSIKVGRNWFTVVGVAHSRSVGSSARDMGIHDYGMEVFLPIHTFLLRVGDRSRVSMEKTEEQMFMMMAGGDESSAEKASKNIHQLDKVTIVIEDNSRIRETAAIIRRMLTRRHNDNKDFSVVVPEELLAQEQETQNTFSWVLISIAGISLLVGGIGIMNIMLASVLERIREIGVRLALGATRTDIIIQFLSEAVTLSVVGGIIGIAAGLGVTKFIEWQFGITTIIMPSSILLSFLVSITIGIGFGLFPARRAAMQDPVVSLRYE